MSREEKENQIANEKEKQEEQEKTKPITRGLFICIEGLDRCGKSTQCDMLLQALQSNPTNEKATAHLMNFPDRSTLIGRQINDFLRNKAALNDNVIHLLFSANRWELKELIEKRIAQGEHVIASRYSYSGINYSCAKERPDLNRSWCTEMEMGLPTPDIVFYLNIDPETASKRSEYGNECYEKLAFQKKVKEKFDEHFDELGNVVTIDASQSVEKIHEHIYFSVYEKASSLLRFPSPLAHFNGSNL